jgi:hypothetical protein
MGLAGNDYISLEYIPMVPMRIPPPPIVWLRTPDGATRKHILILERFHRLPACRPSRSSIRRLHGQRLRGMSVRTLACTRIVYPDTIPQIAAFCTASHSGSAGNKRRAPQSRALAASHKLKNYSIFGDITR